LQSPSPEHAWQTPLQAFSQQRPATQLLLRQSPLVAQLLPSGRGASTQLPAGEQRCPLPHTASQQISPPPCKAGPHSPERQSPFSEHAAPSGSRHCPRPAHWRPAVHCGSALPMGEALQRPSRPAAAQVSQASAHSLSQHTPSKQRPPMHSLSLAHGVPRSLSGLTQAPSPLQNWPSGHASVQHELPPPTAGSQLPEPHSAAVWHDSPLGDRHAPRPKHESPSPQLVSPGSATHVPVESQLSHGPSHASRQQTPSTQVPSAQSMSL
jgi:hypothetical protein